MKETRYEKEIDFNKGILSTWKQNGACSFYLGWRATTSSKRSLSHTNGLAGTSYYSEMMIDLCAIEGSSKNVNNSPDFASSHIAILCTNDDYFYNSGTLDKEDYDFLTYELVLPLVNHKVNGKYKSPFYEKFPLSTSKELYLDPYNGDLVIYSPDTEESSQTTTKIYEWRKDKTGKYVLIGYQYRDLFVKVKDCGYNWPPTIESDSFQYVVMEGDKLTIDIFSQDFPHPKDTSKRVDSISLSWNHGIPQGSFKILDPSSVNKNAKFEWQTKYGDYKEVPYSFTVQAKDHFCPLHATSIRGFSVRVLRFPLSLSESNKLKLMIYPNPAKDKVTIMLPVNEICQNIRILSLDGKVLYEDEVGEKDAVYEFDIPFLSSGMYIVELSSLSGVYRGRMVKE